MNFDFPLPSASECSMHIHTHICKLTVHGHTCCIVTCYSIYPFLKLAWKSPQPINHTMHNDCSWLLLTLHKRDKVPADNCVINSLSIYPPISFSFHHSLVFLLFLSLISSAFPPVYYLTLPRLSLPPSATSPLYPLSLFTNWNRSMTLNYHQCKISSQICFCL